MFKKQSTDLPIKKDAALATEKPFSELVQTHFRSYCEKSTIHGVRYLYDVNLHNLDRLIWCGLIIFSITECIFFYLMLSERYGAQKLQTVVEDAQLPVFYVQFPAVGICTDNRVDWTKLKAAKEKFLPKNATEQVIEVFTLLVGRMETLRFGNFRHSTELEDLNLEALKFIDMYKLVLFLNPDCKDIFVNGTCFWRSTEFDCCKYFINERTEYGHCHVFNSEISPPSLAFKKEEGANYYPRRNSKAGQGTGLNFELLMDDKLKRPDSAASDNVFIMIKKPTQMSNTVFSMTPNTETYVTVRPEITNTDETTRHISPDIRKCMFADEQEMFLRNDAANRYNKDFLLTNCLSQCHESYVTQLCNCSIPTFFLNNSKFAICGVDSLRCLARHNDIFSYDKRKEEDTFFSATKPGMTCHCLVSCNLIEYYTALTTLPLNNAVIPKTDKQKLFKVDVHYQIDQVVKYRTRLEFSIIDLIANLGGIFGLCLGASMVSVVELLYYLTIGFVLHLHDNGYFAVLLNKIKLKWKKWLRYLRNEATTDVSSASEQRRQWQPEVASHKMLHPFNHKPNAW